MRQTVICANESCICASCSALHTFYLNNQTSAPTLPSRVLVKAKVFLRGDNAECVGVSHSSPPALYANNWISLAENTELDGVHDSPLQTAVNILLPWLRLEIGLLLGEVEWVNAAVQV